MNDINFDTKRMNLKQMLKERGDRIIVAIGVSNGMEAKQLYSSVCTLHQRNKIPSYIGGFITFVSGYLAAASYGLPDLGYILREEIVRLTMTAEQATWMSALKGPLPAFPIGVDIDTGYGSEPFSIALTCRQVARAGGQYVQLEDQYSINKSCGHMAGGSGTGKELASMKDMINLRLRPAVGVANSFEDMTVMARTDAIAVEGFDRAIKRMHAYEEAGAEILFVEAPDGEEQLAKIPREFAGSDSVVLANMIERSPHTPYKSPKELQEMGFGIGLYCIGSIMAGRTSQMKYYETLASGNNVLESLGGSDDNWFAGFGDMIGRGQCEDINMHFHGLE